jgi:chemotaxis protein CheC
MNMAALSQDQTETLQEVVNIAMGQAGDSLARILDVFVELSVPRISLVEVAKVVPTVCDLLDDCDDIFAVRQAFHNNEQLRGESIIIYGEAGCSDLADLMGYNTDEITADDFRTESELLLDVSNILSGACLNGIANQLKTELSYSAPSIMAQHAALQDVMSHENLPWNKALLVEVNFGLENSDFKSHLLILLTEEAIDSLGHSLDMFLENL